MTRSPEVSETGLLSCRQSAKMPEKSNFAQTCGLLSHYLKEKGSCGDLSLGMSCNVEGKGKPETYHRTVTRMNLLRNMEISGEEVPGLSAGNPIPSRNVKSMDLFPQHAGFGPSVSTGDVPKMEKANFSLNKPVTVEPESSQMTILYAGRVLVFNDFPADKAKEVMLLASKSSSHNAGGFASTFDNEQISSCSFAALSSNFISTSGNNLTQERLQRPPQPIASDLPIARTASLQRFLEKRKDRISNARAPYPSSSNSAAASLKPAESKTPWLVLAPQSSNQVELHLL